jgi:hypothetical protein
MTKLMQIKFKEHDYQTNKNKSGLPKCFEQA